MGQKQHGKKTATRRDRKQKRQAEALKKAPAKAAEASPAPSRPAASETKKKAAASPAPSKAEPKAEPKAFSPTPPPPPLPPLPKARPAAPQPPSAEASRLSAERLVGYGIAVFWLFMMFSLVKDAILPRARARETVSVDMSTLAGAEWKDVDEWYRVLDGGKWIGAARFQVRATTRPIGYRADFAARLQVTLINQFAIQVKVAMQMDGDFALTDFHSQLDVLGSEIILRGSVAPDNRLLVEALFERFGDKEPEPGQEEAPEIVNERLAILLDSKISMLEAIRPVAMRSLELREGVAYSFDVIDPIWQMKLGQAVILMEEKDLITINGQDRRAMRARTDFGGSSTFSWIDMETGQTLRRQLLPNRPLVMEFEPPEVREVELERSRRLAAQDKDPEAKKPEDITLADGNPLRAALMSELALKTIGPNGFEDVKPQPLSAIDFKGMFERLDFIPEAVIKQ
jgi:hypothetical protein